VLLKHVAREQIGQDGNAEAENNKSLGAASSEVIPRLSEWLATTASG